MKKSIFDPDFQNTDIPSKIVSGLERLSEAFRVLLWEQARATGLSPIQIQVLIFVAYHDSEYCSVSHLAREFNMTKPTVSDAVRVLYEKGLIEKHVSPADRRAYHITLSASGRDTVQRTHHFARPIRILAGQLDEAEQERFFRSLSKIIYGLNRAGILTVQRTCFGCRFYEKKKDQHFCRLLQAELRDRDIRVDCPEFESRS